MATAFMKPVTPSSELAAIVGSKPLPRTEVTKKLWAYIKKNGLQDPKSKKTIKPDAKLKAVLGGKSSVDMFAMTAMVSKHLKLGAARGSGACCGKKCNQLRGRQGWRVCRG